MFDFNPFSTSTLASSVLDGEWFEGSSGLPIASAPCSTVDSVDAALWLAELVSVALSTCGHAIRRDAACHGDVLAVDRGAYWHYGILATDGPRPTVIHYTSEGSDTSAANEVRETGLTHFLREASAYVVVDLERRDGLGTWGPRESLYGEAPGGYGPEETVRRARGRLGERAYNLVSNNCEHFVVWCKTGVPRSTQVERVLDLLRTTSATLLRAA